MAAKVGQVVVDFLLNTAKFETDIKKATKTFKNMGRELTAAGKTLTTGITLPLVAVGAAVGKAAKDIDEGMDTIRAGTGATGAALTQLGNNMRGVMANVPQGIKDVSLAITDLSSRMGLTGKPLEQMATQMLNLARMSGSEVGPIIASTTRLFGDWSVATDKQSSALDYLFKVSQSTGISIQTLTDLTVKYGAPLRSLGFDLEQSAAMLGKWEKEGVNMETVLSGMRFALGNFAKAGQDPIIALKSISDAIKNAKTESEATAIAFQAFGKRAATDMGRAIIEGRFNIEELIIALKNSKETINSAAADTLSFSEKLDILKNKVMLAAEPLGVALLGAIEKLIPYVEQFVGWLAKVGEWFSNLPAPMQATILAIAATAAAIGPLLMVLGSIATGISTLLPLIGGFVAALSGPVGIVVAVAAVGTALAIWASQNETVRAALGAAWQWLKDTAILIFGGIKDLVMAVSSAISAIWQAHGEQVKLIIGSAWDVIKNIFSGAFTAIKGIIQGALQIITGIIQAFHGLLTGDFKKFGEGIKNIVQGMWNAITAIFKGAINAIVGTVKDMYERITGYFKNMYDKVVGGSIIPDMVKAIQTWFGRLPSIMGDPAKSAAGLVSGSFENMSTDVIGSFENMIDTVTNMIRNWKQTLWDIAKDIGNSVINSIFGGKGDEEGGGGILEKILGIGGKGDEEGGGGILNIDKLKKFGKTIYSGLSSLGSAAMSGISAIGSGISAAGSAIWSGISALASNPVGWAIGGGLAGYYGVKKLVKAIQGKNAWEAGSMEATRDFGGVQYSQDQFKKWSEGLGLSESASYGIRKDLLSSPEMLVNVLAPLAQAQGKLDEFLKSLETVGTSWGTFNFREAFEIGQVTNDWSKLNEVFIDAFEHSQALAKAMPDWENLLSIGTSKASIKTLDELLDPQQNPNLAKDLLAGTFFNQGPLPAAGYQSKVGGMFGNFQSGIDYVPQDMLAYLHRGERVTPASENRASNFNMRSGDINLHFAINGGNGDDLVQVIKKRVIPILKYEMTGGNTGLREAIRYAYDRTVRAY